MCFIKESSMNYIVPLGVIIGLRETATVQGLCCSSVVNMLA